MRICSSETSCIRTNSFFYAILYCFFLRKPKLLVLDILRKQKPDRKYKRHNSDDRIENNFFFNHSNHATSVTQQFYFL